MVQLTFLTTAAALLSTQVLAAPSPVETFVPSAAAGTDAAPTPFDLPTPDEVHIIDGEVVNSTDHRIVARQNQPGLRLLNCDPIYSGGPGERTWKWTSLVVYCDNLGQCNDPNFTPSHNNVCVKKESTREGDFHVWEGGWQGCQFPTGVTFSWRIDGNAQDRSDYALVGEGDNTFRRFSAYKDNKQQAVNWPQLVQRCYKIYWFQ